MSYEEKLITDMKKLAGQLLDLASRLDEYNKAQSVRGIEKGIDTSKLDRCAIHLSLSSRKIK